MAKLKLKQKLLNSGSSTVTIKSEDNQPETEAAYVQSSIEPLTTTIRGGVRISGLSRSEIYRCLANGRIQAVKSGRRTLIAVERFAAQVQYRIAAAGDLPRPEQRSLNKATPRGLAGGAAVGT